MKIGVVDAELIGRKQHRFPNLCCMKISAWHKQNGDDVSLLTSYDNIANFDIVYISKVFTQTQVPPLVLTQPNIKYGGTGFFYDKAPALTYEVEHSKPDYHLYDDWVQDCLRLGVKPTSLKYYTDYSIGYLTRGCFRRCPFCVNKNSTAASPASPLQEFIDVQRPKICFLDDNFFACSHWRDLIKPVVESGKRFQFKQGLDERLLTEERIAELSKLRYDGEVIFAFDNIEDRKLIESKLQLIRLVAPEWRRELKFYVLCGFDRNGLYDRDFWRQDMINLFERIKVLSSYGAKPYIMRYQKTYKSEFSSFYAAVAAWCNQPAMFKKFSFREFAQCRGMRNNGYAKYKRDVTAYLGDGGVKGSEWRSMELVGNYFPDIAAEYFDMANEKLYGLMC